MLNFKEMNIKASKISDMLNASIYGDPNAVCFSVCDIRDQKFDNISFLFNRNYVKYVYNVKSGIVVVSEHIFKLLDINLIKPTIICVKDARNAFYTVLKLFYEQNNNETSPQPGIDPRTHIKDKKLIPKDAYVGEFSSLGNVSLGKNCKIYPNVCIFDDVVIGDNVSIYPFTTIYNGTKIGNNCIIGSKCSIGADGFGFVRNDNKNHRMPHLGNVVIEDYVEIGAGSTIDRSVIRSTIIGKSVKLDSQVHVGHNVEIGENTLIAGQTAIGGSTVIGKNCMIGGQVGIIDNISVGDNVRVLAKAGVFKSVKSGSIMGGTPAIDNYSFKRSFLCFKKLPLIFDYFNKKNIL